MTQQDVQPLKEFDARTVQAPLQGLFRNTTVRLKVEENQLVDVFGEIGFHIDGLKGA